MQRGADATHRCQDRIFGPIGARFAVRQIVQPTSTLGAMQRIDPLATHRIFDPAAVTTCRLAVRRSAGDIVDELLSPVFEVRFATTTRTANRLFGFRHRVAKHLLGRLISGQPMLLFRFQASDQTIDTAAHAVQTGFDFRRDTLR